jgi:hypothetical protein
MNAIASAEYIGLHLGVPTAGLVAKMDTGLQQLFHRNITHYFSLLWFRSSPFLSSLAHRVGHRARD